MTGDSRVWTIAREDLRHVRRSRLLWGAFALIFLLVVPSFWSMTGNLRVIDDLPPPAVQAVLNIPSYLATYLFVLVVALVYGGVASERESGRIRLLLGLPATRRDVLLGKLLSRVGMVVITVGMLLIILGAIIVGRQGPLPVVAFGLVSGWVLLYGAVWTTFAVGVSAAVGSRYRALAAIAGTYVVFAWNAPIWKAVLDPGLRAVVPATYVDSFNPTISLLLVSEWLVAPGSRATADLTAVHAAVSVVSLLAVGTLGLFVGYGRFERVDLG